MDYNTIRETQMALLAMAKDIDALCRKHNITYWIDGGTLLGAVRNGKFIPWDDDLDFNLPVKDYNKLRKVIKEELIPNNPNYFLYNDHRPFPHYSEYLADVTRIKNKFYPIEIDILKVKSLPNTAEAIQKDKEYVQLLSFFFNFTEKLEIKDQNLYEEGVNKGSFLFRRERYLKKFNAYIDSLDAIKTENIFCYPYNDMYVSKTREYYVYDDIFPVQEIEFEGYTFFGPNNPDAYLTKLYTKDYLTPPPKEQQVSLSKSLEKPVLPTWLTKKIIWMLYLLKAVKRSFTLQRRIKKLRG